MRDVTTKNITEGIPSDLTDAGYAKLLTIETIRTSVIGDDWETFIREIYAHAGGENTGLHLFNRMKSEYANGTIWQ